MKKIISISEASSRFSPSLDLKTRFEQALIHFEKKVQDISLFGPSKKEVDPKKVEEINQKFKAECFELISELLDMEQKSAVFAKGLKKLRDINEKLKIYTEPDMYLLALKSMTEDFMGKPINAPITVDLAYPRVNAARKNLSFLFNVADKATAAQIFKDKLLSLQEAEALYGLQRTVPKQECVIAGGAATRYKQILFALNLALKDITDDMAVMNESIFKPLKENSTYKDIKGFLSTKKIEELLNSPIFHSAGFKTENFRKDANGDFFVQDIKKAVDTVINRYNGILKAMDYGYEVDLDGQKIYVTYFLNKYLTTLMSLKEANIHGSKIYFQLDNKKNITALQEMVERLKACQIINPKILDIKFMDEKQAPVVSMNNGHLVLKENNLLTQPTGHGAAFITAGNAILADQKKSVPFSLQNLDNSATKLPKYTTLTHNACEMENQLREELISVLKKDDSSAFFKMIFNPKYAIDSSKYESNKSLPELAAQLIDQRWDYRVDLSKDIVSQIGNLPITIAVVAEVAPGVIQAGGGLFVNRDTQQMAIVDKRNLTKEQEKNADFLTYFNPVLFTTMPKKEMTGDMESNAIFVTEKGTTEKFLKGESASTHLATDPTQVLKRVIYVPFNQKSTLIVEHKYLNETTVSAPENKAAVQQLAGCLKKIAQENGVSTKEMAEKIWDAQEAARKVLVPEKKVAKPEQKISIADTQNKSQQSYVKPFTITQRLIPIPNGMIKIRQKSYDGPIDDSHSWLKSTEISISTHTRS